MGGTDACPLVGVADSYPLVCGALSLGGIRGGRVPRGSLSSQFTDGWACISPELLFGLGCLSTDGWGQIFPRCSLPEKGTPLNIPKSFASSYLPLQQATFTPAFPVGPPRTAVRFDPDSHGDVALPWDPVHVKVCVHLLRMGSPFPPVLWSSCAQAPLAFNAKCSRGSFS